MYHYPLANSQIDPPQFFPPIKTKQKIQIPQTKSPKIPLSFSVGHCFLLLGMRAFPGMRQINQ